jgi:hypothetical protein
MSYNKDFLIHHKNTLYQFCINRGIDFIEKKSLIKSSLNGIICSEFIFSPIYNYLFITIKKNLLTGHKRKLKSILKGIPQNIGKVLIVINKEISFWNKSFFMISNLFFISYNLDIYIQKLFWKYIKRIHLKRTHKWLYNKYWRCINGIWQFFIFDVRGKVIFLRSHGSTDFAFKHISFSLQVFDYNNKRKFLMDCRFEFNLLFSPVIQSLYQHQKGLCFVCKRPFFNTNVKVLNICSSKLPSLYLNKYSISKICLLHFDCHF